MELPLIPVNVAGPQVIGHVDGNAVYSGIAKRPSERKSAAI
jgi:hypothetical protein